MTILSSLQKKLPALAVLIDPDKADIPHLEYLCEMAAEGMVDYFLVGGSLLFKDHLSLTIRFLKENTAVPVILFPGGTQQIHPAADGILLLSLVSGRNPDLLIGKHVESAPQLAASGLEIISTAYLLIDGGRSTSVSYISNTTPLPAHKPELSAATALAATMIGMKTIYLEAGSGALNPVPATIIEAVSKVVNVPIWVGGGIYTPEKAIENLRAGANVIVVGTAIEKSPALIPELAAVIHHYTSAKPIV